MLPGIISEGSKYLGSSIILQSWSTRVAIDFSMFPIVKIYSFVSFSSASALNYKQIISMSGFIKTFNTTLGPKAIGPYSTCKIYNGIMYVSGQVGINPQTSELISDDVQAQTRQAMQNLKTILSQTKVDFKYVLKCTLFLKTMNDFSKVNAIYGEYFKEEPPARACVAVAQLPKGAKFQIQALVAYPYPSI